MASEKKVSMWIRSKVSNLYRHSPTGTYYARTQVGGVDKWATLETDVYSVAEQRVKKKVAELKQGRAAMKVLTRGLATVGDAAKAYETAVELDTRLKPASVLYRTQTIKGLLESWPGLAPRRLSDVTDRDCEEWAKKYSKRVHGTRYNNTLDTLRHIFQIGIDRGLIHRNPAAKVGKVKVAAKKLELPSREKFVELLKQIEESGAWCARDCADLVRFLAYSGARITEAANVTWKDVDGKQGVIWIHGNPDTGTKNSEIRQVPIIESMRELLDRLSVDPKEPRNPKRQGKGYVVTVTERREALETACTKLEIKRITHHDLRHLFATRCIESGVDIPTVSRWLGHKDGGALAMKTYGHLRQEHSLAMAAKVSF
jgi:integrase